MKKMKGMMEREGRECRQGWFDFYACPSSNSAGSIFPSSHKHVNIHIRALITCSALNSLLIQSNHRFPFWFLVSLCLVFFSLYCVRTCGRYPNPPQAKPSHPLYSLIFARYTVKSTFVVIPARGYNVRTKLSDILSGNVSLAAKALVI